MYNECIAQVSERHSQARRQARAQSKTHTRSTGGNPSNVPAFAPSDSADIATHNQDLRQPPPLIDLPVGRMAHLQEMELWIKEETHILLLERSR